MNGETQQPDWAAELYRPHRYKCLYGGRGSGKSWAISAALVLQATQKPLRIACLREHQKSLRESAKRLIEDWIVRLRLEDMYTVTNEVIKGNNGSFFFFAGMSTSSEEDIRGWESVDIAWVEEAHKMSKRSQEILFPTIRKDGSEIWFSFNPQNRSDPVYQIFVVQGRSDAFVRKVNFMDNPFFTKTLDAERLELKENEPERYDHIWLGEPDDEGAARHVLPYKCVQAAVDAWQLRPRNLSARSYDGTLQKYVGLDVADTGIDWNSATLRHGPCVVFQERWRAKHLAATVRRVDHICRENEVLTLFYDVGGVGGGVRSHLIEMGSLPYAAKPVHFGAAVAGKETEYSRGATNEEIFSRRNAQLGWTVRLRAMASVRLLDGDTIHPTRCLFIDPKIPRLESYLAELTQPQWEEDGSGRVKILKRPEEKEMPSPDRFDSTVLAFAQESRYGLKARRYRSEEQNR